MSRNELYKRTQDACRMLLRIVIPSLFCLLMVAHPLASSQSKSTSTYKSTSNSVTPRPHQFSSTYYKGAGRTQSVGQHPRSTPSAAAPAIGAKAAGKSATSPEKELDRLERANTLQSKTTRSEHPAQTAKTTNALDRSSQHNAPINFSYQPVKGGRQSGPPSASRKPR